MKKFGTNQTPATSLLYRVLSTPDLVAAVQALPPERLGALVHEVGLEDAGELVALATTEQLEALFDDDLWLSDEGVEERFDAARFVLWLEVLSEAGEATVVRRLLDLPREFVCMAVAHLAYVVDLDAIQSDVEMDERYHARVERALEASASEEWEQFCLMDRGVGGFDVLVASLFALDTEHSAVLRAILERCCDLCSVEAEERGGLLKALSRRKAAEEAARGERHERRTQRGFVSLADARSFLRLAIAGRDYESGRDPISHAYFRDVYGKTRASEDLANAAKARQPSKRLINVLGDVGVTHSRANPVDTLSAALDVLRERDPNAYERRVAELAYLANVLVTASQPSERRIRPIEASELATRVCAAGIVALGFEQQSPEQLGVTLGEQLLDVVFRAGWIRFAAGDATPNSTRGLLLDLAAELSGTANDA
jgi:hypothetical protein